MGDADDAIVDVLWQKVLDDFESDEPHDELIQWGRSSEQLAEVARRYREHRDGLEDEQLRKKVDKRLAAIAALAMAELDAKRPERPRRHPLITFVMMLVGLLFLAAIASLFRALFS